MRSLELGGSVEVSDRLVGSGAVVVRPNGMLDFRVQAGLSLLGVARVERRLEGWVETPRRAFNVDGDVRGCVAGICTRTEAVASSTGMSGCATVATAGVRGDLEAGCAAAATLRGRAARTGPLSRIPRAQWVPRRPCT
jgi:hypothetical protein